jgi:hypothetical protein
MDRVPIVRIAGQVALETNNLILLTLTAVAISGAPDLIATVLAILLRLRSTLSADFGHDTTPQSLSHGGIAMTYLVMARTPEA